MGMFATATLAVAKYWRESLLVAALAASGFVFKEWLSAHDALLHATATIAAQGQLLAQQKKQYDALTAAEQSRDRATAQQIAAMRAQVAQLKTAAQIAAWLPKQIPTPEPVEITVPATSRAAASAQASSNVAASAAPQSSAPKSALQPAQTPAGNSLPPALATIPQIDLPALRDYVESCKECQAKLAAAQQDLQTKNRQLKLAGEELSAAGEQRDAALKALKGGSFWRRLGHDAKLLLIGGAISSAALCSSGHCR
ncbi:MAG TPA: hypothetical protein VGR81_00325 [Candidatus Acidoferrales bacterium]|nr:hypothetical protein [Candidatus Acidoferrales bacterium]